MRFKNILFSPLSFSNFSHCYRIHICICRHCSIPCIEHYFEQSEQLATRILSDFAEIESHKIRQGKITTELAEMLMMLASRYASRPIFAMYTYREDMVAEARWQAACADYAAGDDRAIWCQHESELDWRALAHLAHHKLKIDKGTYGLNRNVAQLVSWIYEDDVCP